MLYKSFFPLFLLLVLHVFPALSQISTNRAALELMKTNEVAKEKSERKLLLSSAGLKRWPMQKLTRNGKATLTGIDFSGYPLYVSTGSTSTAASSIGTDQLWTGGALGLSLSGASGNLKGRIGIWDGGGINLTHVELRNRVIQKDNPSTKEDHSTHVSGILVGAGINPLARGMSFGAQQLIAYDYNQHVSEMTGEAAGLLISNHSYTTIAGWSYNDTEKRWEFYGRYNENEDYKFGFYSDETQSWDRIAYNAPYYLIVKAAGNNRSENGPAEGEPFFRFNENKTMASAGNRPAGISSNNEYDIIPTYGTAKNILTVGAIEPFSSGYFQPSDAVLTNFSSWGPTDDGRIKPDIVADGINILSATAASDNSYASLSGTSMASPLVAGSLFLLQEYYSQLHGGSFMRSATLKGLLIHTAQEAGSAPGPDYRFGWGVAAVEKAAEVIKSNNTVHLIEEKQLNNGSIDHLTVIASGKGPLIATICWTDPEGQVSQGEPLNDRTPKLINDLDLRVKSGTTTYFPWRLTPLSPSFPATTGDNTLDNVEKIEIPDAVPGEEYTIEISHKGTLENGSQAYSLLVSGAGGTAYCTNSALSTGARITQVKSMLYTNDTSADCSIYKKFGNSDLTVFNKAEFNLEISLGDCSGPVTTKIVKVFIDYNVNGSFEPEELVATSNPVTTAFNTSISLPADLTPGFTTIMRIVVKEASQASEVAACNNTGKGEVQDYKLMIGRPIADLGAAGLESPAGISCPSAQLVTVKIRNAGASPQSNIPLSTVIKNGNTVIATLSATYPGTINGGQEASFTYPSSFNALPGINYTFTTTVNSSGDQYSPNNNLTTTVMTRQPAGAPAGLSARICDGKVRLKGIDNGAGPLFWYETPSSQQAIAQGYDTTTTSLSPNGIYYAAVNGESARAGLPDKTITATGAYAALSGNSIRFTTSVPLVLESGRLYVGNPGRVKITIGKVIDATHYQPVSSVTLNVFATEPSPQPGASSKYEPADAGALYQLNMPIPEPGDYFLIFQCLEGATIFYNSNINANPYPITIPHVIAITSNDPGGDPDHPNPDLYKRYYLGLYDMGIRFFGCSSERIPVEATLCDGQAPVDVSVGPNPSSGSFNVAIDLPGETADLNFALFNMLGQRVFKKSYPAFSGNFFQQLNAGPLPPGIYLLRISHGNSTYKKKIIIGK